MLTRGKGGEPSGLREESRIFIDSFRLVETDREIAWKGASSPSTGTILRVHRSIAPPPKSFPKFSEGRPGLSLL